MPVTNEKLRENLLRRMADRRGYRLMKSRSRDPRDITFGKFQIVDVTTGVVVFGFGNGSRGFSADIAEIAEWLTKPK